VALHAELDGGRCRVANHIVAKLRTDSELPGYAVSVPAEREYVNCLSKLIRVRFPGEGLWDLPVVVHELGHAICDELPGNAGRDAVKAEAAIEQPSLGRLVQSRYEELWCDVFGTYVAGVAFAAACLRLRFDPSRAGEPDFTGTHPSVDKRAVVILATLGHLQTKWKQTGATSGSLAATTTRLEEDWNADVAAAGGHAPATEVAERARTTAAAFWQVLDAHTPTLRHPGLALAQAARPRLVTGEARSPSYGVIDTLNAMWLARLADGPGPAALDQLAEYAMAWCEEVADG
jgi:hypothetical protein